MTVGLRSGKVLGNWLAKGQLSVKVYFEVTIGSYILNLKVKITKIISYKVIINVIAQEVLMLWVIVQELLKTLKDNMG